jgi:SAM-dependent methyltransferase
MDARARFMAAVLCAALGTVGTVGILAVQQRPARTPDIHWVGTPQPIADAMLKLARVTAADVVYDLGSGDGRIVIAAARDFGARGVGIEIDPRLVAESTRRAERAGLADRVRFTTQDLFQADLRPATVVTLYLTRELNIRLRPKLLAELRPGTRVVSHRFDMGDWPPEREVKLDVDGNPYVVYLWRIP